MIDIKQYDVKKFHHNELINKKIVALFLLYDKKVDDNSFNYKGEIRLIGIFIEDLIKFEEYEVVIAFEERKLRRYREYRNERRGKITMYLRFRALRFKFNSLLRKIKF